MTSKTRVSEKAIVDKRSAENASPQEKKMCMFLKELYDATRTGPVSSVELQSRKMAQKYGIGQEVITVLAKNGLLKLTRGRGCTTEWCTREPNLQMARRVIDKSIELRKQYYGSKELVQQEETETNELVLKETMIINILKEDGKTFDQISSLLERT